MPNTVSIVPYQEEYLDGYFHCLDAVARERKYIGFIEAPPYESVKAFMHSGLEQKAIQLVAIANGLVVGWIDIFPSTLPGFTHNGRLGMGLLKEFRGQGIGTRLMEETLRAARTLGLERVELEVFVSNATAIGLYRKFGFEDEGIRRKARKLGEEYDDILLMALFLK